MFFLGIWIEGGAARTAKSPASFVVVVEEECIVEFQEKGDCCEGEGSVGK